MTPENALKLAYWIGKVHPKLFAQLARAASGRAGLSGLGDDGTDLLDVSVDTNSSAFDTSNIDLGNSSYDLLGIPGADPSGMTSQNALTDLSSFALSPSQLQPIGLPGAPADISTGADVPTALTPDQLQTVGITLPDVSNVVSTGSSIGAQVATGGVTSALQGVANYLTSAQGVSAVANLVKAVANSQAASVLQSQVARATTGQSPANISYAVNPYTGQTTPVLTTAAGSVPLSSSILSQITPSSFSVFLSQYGLYIALGLGLLLAAS